MGIKVEVGLGPLRWSRSLRIPRAQRNALTLLGSLLYVAALTALWVGCAVALLYGSGWAVALFLALGVTLGIGAWWLGRQAWEQWRPEYGRSSRT